MGSQRHFSWFGSFARAQKKEQSWRSGESARLPPKWPGLDSGMWVEFVVGSRLTLRVFLKILRFFFLHKNQRSKFQFDHDRGPA